MSNPKADICGNRSQHNANSFLANLHVAGRKLSQQERIYLSLRDYGPQTSEELSLRLGMRYTSVSARLSELKADDRIMASGAQRKTTGGEMADVMQVLNPVEHYQLTHRNRRYEPRQGALFEATTRS